MSLEGGGRADKYGNEYENRFLAALLLRIVAGELSSITVEPLGENHDSVEYIAESPKGERYHYQCKASNNTKEKWNPSDLKQHDVFMRSKSILEESNDNRYKFISPLSYGELSELCNRARTCSNGEELITYQLTNDKIKKTFHECEAYYGLSADKPQELIIIRDLLSRTYFETVSFDDEALRRSKEYTSLYFSGNASAAQILLQNYVSIKALYGKRIVASDIITYMEENGVRLRRHLLTDNINAAIAELNELFDASFTPIQGRLIHREATDEIMNAINIQQSVILHGKAGTGKSGCIQEVIQRLKEERIPYLALKLDKQMPQKSPDNYGKELGLGQSPVYCLSHIAGKKQCVFIIDQLDSVRWMSQHSANALNICKMMIRQAETMNRYEGAQVTVLLISRTFDLETDAGLQALTETKGDPYLSWKKIQIDEFTDEEVRSYVGSAYITYSKQLQSLLKIPSTLYIWTKLEKGTDITSAVTTRELMQKWWNQILDRCAKSEIGKDRIPGLKDKIVSGMSKKSSLSLPFSLFSDDTIEIEKLISEGLLLKHGSVISFAHQSFFDFFATDEMMRQIYNGGSIVGIIGGYDDQTPFIRYRFISVLQQLADTEESLFTDIARQIVNSSSVRFYFKFAVPEIAGQQKSPSIELLSLVYTLFQQQEWHDAVLRRVYYGHLPYILDLDKRDYFGELTDEALGLLRSAYALSPDFVISKINGVDIQSLTDARKIYQVLSPDLSCDTPQGHRFRLALMERYPDLYDNVWGLHQLAQSKSSYLIAYLKSMVEHIDSIDIRVYLSDKNTYEAYAKTCYRETIEGLFPVVVAATAQFRPSDDPSVRFNESFENWLPFRHRHHFARTIVDMLKAAVTAFYQNEPKNCVAYIKGYSGEKSVILYEVFSSTVLSMDKADSDFAIQWLCDDPQNHLFIYTNRQDDYLSLTKQIIAKHSPCCSDKVFRALESIVLHWKEPVAKMVHIYRKRIEISQKYSPVYSPYWGMLQKELLPHMDPSRLSKESKELLCVLERNDWIKDSFYNCGISSMGSGGVASPVDKKLDYISDSTWLKIVATPVDKMSNRFSHNKIDGEYIEANHDSFASSLSRAAKKDPERFAELALQFPEGCPDTYITGVLNAIRYPDDGADAVNKETLFSLIERFKDSENPHIIQEIMGIIERFSQENWTEDIIDYICDTATRFGSGEAPPSSYITDDESSDTFNSLVTDVINSVSGYSLKAMGKLLEHHPELFGRFVPVFDTLLHRGDDVAHYALTECLFPLYQIDPEYALALFRELLSRDIRILGYPGAWNLILEDHENNGPFYAEKLSKATASSINGLNDEAAGMLCAYTVFFDQTLFPTLCADSYSERQVNEICRQAISSFDKADFHEISRDILLYFIKTYDKEIFELNRLFSDKRINIYRDKDFLTELMESKQAQRISYQFLEYIKEQDQDVTLYLDVLRNLSESALKDRIDWRTGDIINSLTVIVLGILDKNQFNRSIKQICLDIWDNIYQSCYEQVKPLTELLDTNG
ncbi:MAG: hypothetical protein IJ639_02190 [Ruminococcus sp.]|nr:hypothetical protein [Ruminococcus sp.]